MFFKVKAAAIVGALMEEGYIDEDGNIIEMEE